MLTTGRLVNGSSCDGIDMIKILHDVVGTSGYRCGVLRSFSVERIEQGIGYKRKGGVGRDLPCGDDLLEGVKPIAA
ncbi:hypothetical protein Tco_1038177 [Tanacetum coccineum]